MKKLLFLLLLFFTTFLMANQTLDDFITQQLKVEKQLIEDNNITLEKKIKIKKIQVRNYQDFFLQYAANKNKFLSEQNPYKQKLAKLKLRYNSNKQRGYKNATLRDELLLKDLTIRNAINNTLKEALRFTNSESKHFYEDKINELLVKQFSNYKPVEIKKYILDENLSTPLQKEILSAYNSIVYLEHVGNSFSAELIDNSSNIYRTASLSNSRIFTFLNNLNTSDFGQALNVYLTPLHFDTARLILILLIIVFIILVQKLTKIFINQFLIHYKLREDDIKYIHSHITNIFNTITSLVIIHLIVVVVIGFDNSGISISKIFAVIYIILTALLLYRITNTIAYLKIERMKKSKVLKDEVVNLSLKVINGFIILIAIIAILKILGVDLTALLSGLGIAGAAVAFAAKDSIANIFGSVSILAGDVFEQGDWIETKDVNGTVVEIGLRATTVRTFDNALISVPNFELSNKGVKNWTRRSIGRRIKMNVGVTYESDFDDIKKAIEEIREMLKVHPGIANEHTSYLNPTRQAKLVSIEDLKGVKRTTLVYMDEFAGSSINILIYCFSRTVDWTEWLEVKEDVMFKIADILKQNNLEFAYPTMMIHQADLS